VLEIVFLVWAYKRLALMAEDKWRTRAWGWLGVGLWVLGEVTGLLVGLAVARSQAMVYVMALCGAVLGIGIAFLVVNGLDEQAPVDASTFD